MPPAVDDPDSIGLHRSRQTNIRTAIVAGSELERRETEGRKRRRGGAEKQDQRFDLQLALARSLARSLDRRSRTTRVFQPQPWSQTTYLRNDRPQLSTKEVSLPYYYTVQWADVLRI